MSSRKREPEKPRRGRPASTPEGREAQLVGLAVDLAEKQMADGTASAQVVTHYLKLGSTRERLEQDRLRKENALLEAKVKSMASAERVEELYEQALNAMRTYAGQEPVEYDEYDDDR
jgi:hypothetical protein